MFCLFKKKDLSDYLKETKKVRVKGFDFVIRKIDVLDYVDGSKILKQTVDTYKAGEKTPELQINSDKVRSHYIDVLTSAVVSPKIVRKKEEQGIFVEDLFVDWALVSELYENIFTFTYGKKKLKLGGLQELRS